MRYCSFWQKQIKTAAVPLAYCRVSDKSSKVHRLQVSQILQKGLSGLSASWFSELLHSCSTLRPLRSSERDLLAVQWPLDHKNPPILHHTCPHQKLADFM